MVDVLVFSKDRPAQLDLLLRSIDTHAPDLYSTITVLYTASSADFYRGYSICFAEHANVRFELQSDFERDVKFWLSRTNDAVSFLVDDDVFYADFSNKLFGPGLDDGLPRDAATVVRTGRPLSLRGGDYDYPFSVDGNIYTRDTVRDHVALYSFRDPTELEANGHDLREALLFSEVLPVDPPCLVGVPANRVSQRSGMPHMGIDPRMLNEAFLRGERIIPLFDRETYPAHWPVEYKLGVLA